MRAAEAFLALVPMGVILFATVKKVNVYNAFASGAKEALRALFNMLPYLAAMLAAVEALRGSGLLDGFVDLLRPAAQAVGIDPRILPLIVLRPFSGSASLALLKDTLTEVGPDSPAGRAAAVLVGSTETAFYTCALYLGSVGVNKSRQAIPAAAIGMAVGCAAALLLAKWL